MNAIVGLVDPSVVKNSSAIQITGKMGLLARRAWNVLLAMAYDNLRTQDEHTIKVSALAEILEFDSTNTRVLKDAVLEMMGAFVEWNILEKDRVQKWGAYSLLSRVEVDEQPGTICYAYDTKLRDLLHNPAMFARLNLRLQNKFRSKYGLMLHELMYDYFDATRQAGETPWMSIEQFRQLMGVEAGRYPDFGEFSRSVISLAVDEVNTHSELKVEAIYQRDLRRVSAVKFVAKGKRGSRIKLPALPPPRKSKLPARARNSEWTGPREKGRGIGW